MIFCLFLWWAEQLQLRKFKPAGGQKNSRQIPTAEFEEKESRKGSFFCNLILLLGQQFPDRSRYVGNRATFSPKFDPKLFNKYVQRLHHNKKASVRIIIIDQ